MARITPIVRVDTLHYQQNEHEPGLTVGTPDWYAWLETVSTFAFHSEHGSFTARKEQPGNKRGSGYWKAYRMHKGKLVRAYLGKSEVLTLERLNAIAAKLAQEIANDESDVQESMSPASASPPMSTYSSGSVKVRRSNLSPQLSPLIGREQEIGVICTLLRQMDVRLLTLAGTGGVGKTSLALQVATRLLDDFTDGVYFVSLAPISDPNLVIFTIAQVLGLKEVGNQPLLERLKGYLQSKHLLLVLDNFEQVIPATTFLAELLKDCSLLKALVTSREVLRLRDEQVFDVPPLTLPNLKSLPATESLSQYAAVALFLQHAKALKPDFQITAANARTLVEICTRLDGLPLAIELAAARIRLLSPQQLLGRLERRLQVLTGGVRDLPERHQTLRSTIQWSYDLLNSEEKQLFRQLAVFVGGLMVEAAETVCHAVCLATGDEPMNVLNTITSLLDKHLLHQREVADGRSRLLMLETIREYGLECLEKSGEMEVTRRAHAEYYQTWVEESEPKVFDAGEGTWFDDLEREYENLRAALQWFVEWEEIEMVFKLSGALVRFWGVHGYISEGRQWLERTLPARERVTAPVRAKALCGAGWLAHEQNDIERSEELCRESLALYRELGDKRGIALALHRLGGVYAGSNYALSRSLLEESVALYREVGDRGGIAYSLMSLGSMSIAQGDYTGARSLLEESLALLRQGGNTEGKAWSLLLLGNVLFTQGHGMGVTSLLEESLALFRAISNREGMARALSLMGQVSFRQGDYVTARLWFEESLALLRELGSRNMVLTLSSLARVTVLQGDYVAAHALYTESIAIFKELNSESNIVSCLEELGGIMAQQNDPVWAARLWGAAETLRKSSSTIIPPSEYANYERLLAAARYQLGKKAFEAAWAEGRTMSIEAALAGALLTERKSTTTPPGRFSRDLQPSPVYPAGLSVREVEVLRLVAMGLTDPQIAEKLVLSPRTVNAHLRSIYNKLQVGSRTAATRFAVEHHLISQE